MRLLLTVLLTIGILALVEGLILAVFPKVIKSSLKNIKLIRKAGMIEIIFAVILLGIILMLEFY